MNICIFGGGNIAHSLTATLAQWMPVTVITHHPEVWQAQLTFNKARTIGRTSYPVSATSDITAAATASIVFIAVPQFAYESAISTSEAIMSAGSTVVFVPAPAKAKEYMTRLCLRGINVVGFQRVPYISRIIERGKSVDISADRPVHRIAVSDASMKDDWGKHCAEWFGGKTDFLSSFLIFTFNNSNPILHPARMAVLFDNWRNRTYPTNPYFYAEWTDESSKLYLAADDEMAKMVATIPEIDSKHDYIPLRTHYNVSSPSEMTAKLRSIPPFKQIHSPMTQSKGQWQPDFSSRYFTEDVDYGLNSIYEKASKLPTSTPAITYLFTKLSSIRNGIQS